MGYKPPQFPASTIEQVCRVLGKIVTGAEIPNLIASARASTAVTNLCQQRSDQIWSPIVGSPDRVATPDMPTPLSTGYS